MKGEEKMSPASFGHKHHHHKVRRRLVILFILGSASVLPTLWGTFIFDDGEAIAKNEDVIAKDKSTIVQILRHDFWGAKLSHPQSHKSYRPLTTLTYRLDFQLWGHRDLAYNMRLIDLLIHGVNCSLVYLFLRKCVSSSSPPAPAAQEATGVVQSLNANANGSAGIPRKSSQQGRQESNPRISKDEVCFWASVLFAVHPIHVEPVGTLVGRADLLSALTFLLAYVLISEEPSMSTTIQLVTVGIIGSLFKENTIVILVFYIGIHILKLKTFRSIKPSALAYHALTLLAGFLFVQWRLWFQNGPPVFQPCDNPAVFAARNFTKISSVVYIWLFNAFLLVCPMWLCYDWSMGCIALIESPLDVRFGIIVLAIGAAAIFLYKSRRSKIILISVFISASTFLPSSNLLVTVGFVIAERNLYLVSIGFCLLTAHTFTAKNRLPFLVFVAVLFFSRSVHRSVQWTSQDKLFNAGLQVCPRNAKIHYNLGTIYGEAGNTSLAIRAYRKAIHLRPDYYQSMNNLGNILRTSGRLDEAEYWLRHAVQTKEDFPPAWMNLGIVLSHKNPSEALKCYKRALQLRRRYPDCEYNLGNLYLDLGKSDLALESWKKAISLNPKHTQAWINLVVLLDQQEKLTEAQEWGLKALKFMRDDDTLQFVLGNVAGKLKQYNHAEKHFKTAIEICLLREKPVPAKYWANLGVLFHRWGKSLDAVKYYEEALRLDPTLESAKKNLDMLTFRE